MHPELSGICAIGAPGHPQVARVEANTSQLLLHFLPWVAKLLCAVWLLLPRNDDFH